MYNTADSLIVGNILGSDALAAVSSSGSLIFLLVGFFNGIAVGAGVVISKYFGAKDYENLKKAVHTDVAFGLVAGVLLTVIGMALAPQILVWMGTPEEVLPNSILYFRMYFAGSLAFVMYNIVMGILQAVGDSRHPLYYLIFSSIVLPNSILYFRMYFAGSLAFVMYNIVMGILQAVGDSRHPLYYLIFSSIINVALDLLFVGVFGWGVASAAAATAISQAASALLCFIRLVRTKEVYQVDVREIRFHRTQLRQIIQIGLPSGMQNSIISIANIVVQSNINKFGVMAVAGCGVYSKIEGFAFLPITCFAMSLTTFIGQNLGARQLDINKFGVMAVAGCGVYSKIEGFAFLPITCFAMSLTTFIGQNLGARQLERAKKGAVFGIFCSMSLAELVGLCVFFLMPYLAAAFDNSAAVVEIATRQAHVEALFYCLLAFSHCIAGIVRGAGKSTVPMLVMLASWCLIRITYITVTVHFIPKLAVIFWAYPLTWSISSIIFLLYFVKGKWLYGFEGNRA